MSAFASRLSALLLRDVLLIALCASLWMLAVGTETAGLTGIALAVGVTLPTVIAAYIVHEWGHLLGALVAGSRVELPRHPFASVFLFRFDSGCNTRRQFCAMSLGGFAASLVAVAALALGLPRGELATTLTLVLVALGVAATLLIEVPEFLRVWRGAPLPRGAAYVSSTAPDRSPH